jgi:trehalose synthase
MREVPVLALDTTRLTPFLAEGRPDQLAEIVVRAREQLQGRIVWNINSTWSGGGVAEMLKQVVAYARGADVDARWLVLAGDPDFFVLTKRLHNMLHGQQSATGVTLGPAERAIYEATLARATGELTSRVRPGDIVVIHDPQPAGLAAAARAAGARVVWRCHIGSDQPNDASEQAWAFLRPYVEDVERHVFTRSAYAPDWAADKCVVIAPAIDPLAPKNAPMTPKIARAIGAHIGLLSDGGGPTRPAFRREDGSTSLVVRAADVVHDGPRLRPDVPLVVQVSRWDRLKDMTGVLDGFVSHVVPAHPDAHLALVGPATAGVSDDPEGAGVFAECISRWQSLERHVRERVSLVSLPMDDIEENAAMVNALQRHATVVVQKSIVEGFGLTVSEAMWKSKPVVATRVGGITDQIADGTGVLLDDPRDTSAFGAAVRGLLDDPAEAERVGKAAHERVRDRFLPDRQLAEWATVLGGLV